VIDQLTHDELATLRMKCSGMTAGEIGQERCRHPQSIKNMVSRIYDKMGLQRVNEANRGYRACYILGRDEERVAIVTRVREIREGGVHHGWTQGEKK
jgi:DNA-binding NarL/FixJ family response regulator